MIDSKLRGCFLLSVFLAGLTGAGVALAGPQEDYYRAYYLQNEKGDLEGALKLYSKVAESRKVDRAMASAATLRARCCREDLRSDNLARLMPPETLVYVELRSPGEHLTRLLEQLGLIRDDTWKLPEKVKEQMQRFAVSPALLNELSGFHGIAVAINGFDPVKQMPSFVAVIHSGDNDILRGALETAIFAAGEPVGPVRGTRLFMVEGFYVALTPRLVVISQLRTEVDRALKRLAKDDVPSLADSQEFLSLQGDQADRMLFACLNAKLAMPLVQTLMGAAAQASQEFQMANALLDLDSLRWVVLRAGVGEDGISESLVVRFDEDQNNLVYNFLRTPPLTRSSLSCVPAGAAGFMAVSLSEADDGDPPRMNRAKTVRRITGLDLGREFFANIEEKVLFLLPPGEGADQAKPGPAGFVMPDVGMALTVKDPDRSSALWSQLLALPTFATGQPTPEGKPMNIANTKVTMYEWPEGIRAYFANVDDHILIAMTERAIYQSIRAARGGDSVLTDEAFKPSLARLNEHSSKVLFAHAGRCVQVARSVSGEDLEEIAPFEHLMDELVACFVTDESNSEFRLTVALTGIPEIGGVIEQLVHGHTGCHGADLAAVPAKGKPCSAAKTRCAKKAGAREIARTEAIDNERDEQSEPQRPAKPPTPQASSPAPAPAAASGGTVSARRDSAVRRAAGRTDKGHQRRRTPITGLPLLLPYPG